MKSPNKSKLIDCKLIYKIKKREANESDIIFKIRLIVKGFIQREGINYTLDIPCIVKYTYYIRILLTLPAQFDLVGSIRSKNQLLHNYHLDEKLT